MSVYATVAKTIAATAASISATQVAKTLLDGSLPVAKNAFEKVVFVIGGATIAGAVGLAASQYVEQTAAEIASVFGKTDQTDPTND